MALKLIQSYSIQQSIRLALVTYTHTVESKLSRNNFRIFIYLFIIPEMYVG